MTIWLDYLYYTTYGGELGRDNENDERRRGLERELKRLNMLRMPCLFICVLAYDAGVFVLRNEGKWQRRWGCGVEGTLIV
jgi:hypothetical protein